MLYVHSSARNIGLCWLIACFLITVVGLERKLSSSCLKNGQLPLIIGILSFPDEQMMRRCESSGMHGVLAKPITKATLSDCIQRLMVSESCTSGSSSICWKADMQLRSGVFPSTAGVISEQQVRSCSARTEQTSKDEPLERASSAPLQLSPFNSQEADPLGLGDLNTT